MAIDGAGPAAFLVANGQWQKPPGETPQTAKDWSLYEKVIKRENPAMENQ